MTTYDRTGIGYLAEVWELACKAGVELTDLLRYLEILSNQQLPPLAITPEEFERIAPEWDTPKEPVILTDELLGRIALQLVATAHLAALGAKTLYQLSGNEAKARAMEQEGFHLAGFCAEERNEESF